MHYLRRIADISKNDTSLAGGKGASLGEMTQAGIPVPPGFVILANAFEVFLTETDLHTEIESVLSTVQTQEMRSVEHASEKIQKLILEAQMPGAVGAEIEKYFQELDAKYVAVRSSATAEDSNSAAWAGQLDTFLNTTKEDLLKNVQKCWASLFTPRAIFYRFEKGLHATKISVAVVVQKMVQSEISGIAFSVHPVTEDHNQLIIEAGYGLGEAIVSGQITPDSYVVVKGPRVIIEKNIVSQERGIYRKNIGEEHNEWRVISDDKKDLQKLSDEQIRELSELIITIEKHYGFPCDIEWAFEDKEFYIVQSRPITTLGKSVGNTEDEWITLGTWKGKPFNVSFWFETRHSDFYKKLRLETYGARFDSAYINFNSIVLKQDYLCFKEEILKSIRTGNGICQEAIQYAASLHAGYEKLEESFDIQQFCWYNRELASVNLFMRFFEMAIQDYFSENETKVSYDEFLARIPHKPSLATLYLQELRSLDIADTQVVEIFVRRWAWLGANPETGVQALSMSSVLLDKSSLQDKNEHTSLPLTGELQSISAVATDMAYTRIYFFENHAKILFRNFEKLKAFSRENSGGELNFLLVSHKEILEKLVPTQKELKEREEDFGFVYVNDNLNFFTGEDLVRSKSKFRKLFEIDTTVTKLQGNVGNRGFFTGRVKIISSAREIHTVKSGEVLVASETTPDYIPGMSVAGAFVTDTGGVTSHAAIVAREMNKPCIIGTKVATQVLKDGDLVEVDADNGVVRVLQKSKSTSDSTSNENLTLVITSPQEMSLLHKYSAWSKNWESEFSLLAADIGLRVYRTFQDLYGASLTPIIAHKKGVTSCFYADAELDFFTEQLWKLYTDNNNVLDRWIKEAKGGNDKLAQLITEVDTIALFHDFNVCVDAFGAPNFAIREITNPLDASGDTAAVDKVTEYRKYTEMFYYNMDVFLQKLIQAIMERSGYTKELIESLTLAELALYTEGGLLPDRESLQKRYESSVGWWVADQLTYYAGDIDEALSILHGTYDGSGSFTGVKAYGGKARGIVKLITSYDNSVTLGPDNILVTGMTDPRFIHLMYTAKAFITDAGGMLSHAAIVARELKKPCIVGTKVATQVLQDGDLVEVDADNGVVRILERTGMNEIDQD